MDYVTMIKDNIVWFVIGLLALTIILLLMNLIQGIKLRKLRKNYAKFMTTKEGIDIESLLIKHTEQMAMNVEKMNELNLEVESVNTKVSNCVQRVGLVRYSAFEDVGSDLSFALALLDEKNDGVILNGIFARNNSYIYGKPILAGESTYKLSEEELKAINKAMTQINQREASLQKTK